MSPTARDGAPQAALDLGDRSAIRLDQAYTTTPCPDCGVEVVEVRYASPSVGPDGRAVRCDPAREVFSVIGQGTDARPIVARIPNGLALHACNRKES